MVIPSSEVQDGRAHPLALSPAYHRSCGRRGNSNSSKRTAERVGSECRNVFFVARSKGFGAENAVVEHERSIEHCWVANAFSRRSVDAKLDGIHIVVDGERQAPSEGDANPTSGANIGR
jgi:hypothetical protein